MAGGLRAACAFLEDHLGSDVSEWAWGRLHVCHFKNSGAGQLGDFLNAPPFASGGNSDTIAQVTIGNIDGAASPQAISTTSSFPGVFLREDVITGRPLAGRTWYGLLPRMYTSAPHHSLVTKETSERWLV